MVADIIRMSMAVMMESMEVVENIKPREIEPRAPEWTGNPGIQIGIIGWRKIVGDDWRSFRRVVIVDHWRFSVLRSRGRWAFSVPVRDFSNDRQFKFRRGCPDYL